MGQIKSLKHLSINVQYRTESELKLQLRLVKEHSKLGVENFRKKIGVNKTEYNLQFLNDFNFEEKTIDGKLTWVIQSKMNND